MKRRLLSMVTALALCLTLLPTVASAAGVSVGSFTVEGGVQGTDYEYANSVLTVMTATPLTIRNTDPNTPTTDHILVAKDVSADVTLAGVNIDVSAIESTSAFEIASNPTGSVTLRLTGENALKSGSNRSGLEMGYERAP